MENGISRTSQTESANVQTLRRSSDSTLFVYRLSYDYVQTFVRSCPESCTRIKKLINQFYSNQERKRIKKLGLYPASVWQEYKNETVKSIFFPTFF